jgi:L-ascorbate metabolism protein UlaG (beta-lactamase superfamily)
MGCIRYSGLRLERVEASSQFADGKFHNTARVAPGIKGNPLPTIGEYFFGGEDRTPKSALPVLDPRPVWSHRPDTRFRATWLGHSTVLLEMDGATILTDPVFGDRASPVSFAGPKRFHPTPVSIDELPPLDAVLLSHDHYDHLCRRSMVELGKRGVPIVTSLGVGARLEALGIPAELITELDWGESATSPSGRIRFHARPAQHFSGRGLSDRNVTLWSSWVIESENRRVFFSGDTGLTDEFADTGSKYGPFDLVMLEVGAFHPSWGDIHLGPENALAAFGMLGAGTLLPVHWGTFNLALHAWHEPAETLLELAQRQSRRIVTPRLGAPMEPTRVEGVDPWWREFAELHPARLQQGEPTPA